jgi:hypothetical protein
VDCVQSGQHGGRHAITANTHTTSLYVVPRVQPLLPVAALAPVRPNPTKGLPHTAVKQAGLSQGHPNIAGYTIRPPACQQRCQLRRESLHAAQLPFDGAGFAHVTGLDDIAASCISRVANAACTEGGGASEGRTHSVEVQTELLPATPSSHSKPASLPARTYG